MLKYSNSSDTSITIIKISLYIYIVTFYIRWSDETRSKSTGGKIYLKYQNNLTNLDEKVSKTKFHLTIKNLKIIAPEDE